MWRITLLIFCYFYSQSMESSKVGSFCIINNEPKKTVYKNSPLHNAIRQNSLENIKKLIGKKTYNNAINDEGMTPLAYAAKANYSINTIQTLIEHGAHVDIPDNVGNTALYHAVQNGNVELVELLLKYNADPTRHNKQGTVLLITAHESWYHSAYPTNTSPIQNSQKIEQHLKIYELIVEAVKKARTTREELEYMTEEFIDVEQ